MLKIRRPLGRLIFNMGIAIPGKTVFLIETAARPFQLMMSEADHLDAFTRLSDMDLLQDSDQCKLKTAHACCISGRTQESMMPMSRHSYPKCKKGPQMSQHVKKFVPASPPPWQAVMNINQASQSHGPYMEVCPVGQRHMLKTSWAWMAIFSLWSNATGSGLWRWWISWWRQWHGWRTHDTF